jgi:hypothetical protein
MNMPPKDRTAAEWFAEAARTYLEGHQACAWCGRSYQVRKVEKAHGVEFHCHFCDFHASHDATLDRYRVVPGESNIRSPAPLTMLDTDNAPLPQVGRAPAQSSQLKG